MPEEPVKHDEAVDAEPLKPRDRSRSLTGFYIALGTFAALFGLAVWLWHRPPVRVWYLEREIKRISPMGFPGDDRRYLGRVRELVEIGPPARAAVARLLEFPNNNLQDDLKRELGKPGRYWALPTLIRQIADDKEAEDWVLLDATNGLCERRFSRGLGQRIPLADGFAVGWSSNDYAEMRRRILDWWEHEGKGKYGRVGND